MASFKPRGWRARIAFWLCPEIGAALDYYYDAMKCVLDGDGHLISVVRSQQERIAELGGYEADRQRSTFMH